VAAEKLHVIYNGVDLEHFHPRHRAGLRAAARDELGAGERDFLFLFVGSGFWRKGLDAAIAALAACRDASFRLAVAGRDRDAAGFLKQAAAAGLGDRLRLLGGQEDPRRLYAAADCFILPTRYDPFPNTVLEALAMGVPVIVGRRSGAAEILRAPGSGQVCDPGNVDGLAQRMREAARAGRSPEGSAAARSVAEHYGIDGMAQRLTTLYATLLAPAGGGRST
jgi:UDP-glucose:(heptosyl)LPS alpha-1,3-glucosyltransferase